MGGPCPSRSPTSEVDEPVQVGLGQAHGPREDPDRDLLGDRVDELELALGEAGVQHLLREPLDEAGRCR